MGNTVRPQMTNTYEPDCTPRECRRRPHPAGSRVTTANQATMPHPIIRFALVLALAFYLPVGLILIGAIPFAFRFHVLLLVSIGLAIYAYASGYTLRELGVRSDNLAPSLLINAGLAAALALPIVAAYAAGLIREPTLPDWNLFFVCYVLVFCPAQEFSCRGLLFAAMNRSHITGPLAQISISAVSYAFLHTVYHDWLTMAATIFMGIVWGVVYRAVPNLWGVMLSHAVLGVVSIELGLI